MGFQSAINNILTQTAITTRAVKFAANQKEAVELAKEKEQRAAAAEALEKEQAEMKSIADTENKINEAIKMSVGYSNKEIKAQQAAQAMGINNPQKNPRGVSTKTFERRTANATAMQEILTKASQNKDFRERLEKFTSKDLANALNPQIRTRPKGGKK